MGHLHCFAAFLFLFFLFNGCVMMTERWGWGALHMTLSLHTVKLLGASIATGRIELHFWQLSLTHEAAVVCGVVRTLLAALRLPELIVCQPKGRPTRLLLVCPPD